jgi:hypothetical protein
MVALVYRSLNNAVLMPDENICKRTPNEIDMMAKATSISNKEKPFSVALR